MRQTTTTTTRATAGFVFAVLLAVVLMVLGAWAPNRDLAILGGIMFIAVFALFRGAAAGGGAALALFLLLSEVGK